MYLDAAWARNLADQKTVTYYAANINSTHGPNVAITSSGTVNPNPESDLWIDTNTNRLYIYKTNSEFAATYVNPDSGTDKTAWAQTVHSGAFLLDGSSFSGWWDVQDTELRDYIIRNDWASANALAEAATSQAAADREILAFFTPSEDNFVPVGIVIFLRMHQAMEMSGFRQTGQFNQMEVRITMQSTLQTPRSLVPII